MVDGVEVFALKIEGIPFAYALEGNWLWIHVAVPVGPDDSKTWFHTMHTAAAGSQIRSAAAWDWARGAVGASATGLVGFVDPSALFGALATKLGEVRACANLFAPVSRVAFGLGGDGTRIDGHLVFDLGSASARVTALALPVPAGWDAASKEAPLGAQWNLDLFGVREWADPCFAALDEAPLDSLGEYGVRGARATVFSFDPDDLTSSTAAISADLSSKRYFADKLDDIPMLSSLEKRRTFGVYQGASVSIPFVGSIEYVLTNTVGLVAFGGDLLGRMVGAGAPVRGALARVDLVVGAMPEPAWQGLFRKLGMGEESAERLAGALLAWHELHVALGLTGSALVLEAHATRN